MAKITLPTIAAGYASNTAFNTAYDAIEAEFQNKVLYRNNTSGETNTMTQALDMNSQAINNCAMLTATGLTIGGVSLTAEVAAAAASATAAAASATAAASSATAASSSATAAASSATSAAASYDSFDDRYLGSKSSAPTVDNDGDALITGALYWNTTSNVMSVRTAAAAWTIFVPSASELADIAALAPAAVIADMDLLGTAANVTAMGLLGVAAVITDMGILGTADVVTDMNVLGTADVVTDMNTLGTADVVSDMNTLGTATVVANLATVSANVAGVNSFADLYRGASGSAPTGTITTGTLYYNTTGGSEQLYIWDGSAWQDAAFSASGTVTAFNTRTGAITLSSADVTGALSTGAIATAKIADDAVTTDKLANSINTEITANTAKTGITGGQATAITANTAKVTNATHSGDVTGATSLTIANDAVTLAMMAHGTDGELITYDTSGAPANVPAGTAGQVLTSAGADAVPTFQTAASGVPTKVDKDFVIATGASTTAGRGVSIAADGKISPLPTVNTLGSRLQFMPRDPGGLFWDANTADGSKGVRMAVTGSMASRIGTITGYAISNTGVLSTGSTTVTVEMKNYVASGSNNLRDFDASVAIDNDTILVLTGSASSTNGGSQPSQVAFRINFLTIADNGDVTKSSDYLAEALGPVNSTWSNSMSHGIAKISETVYTMAIISSNATAASSMDRKKTFTISGTTVASSADDTEGFDMLGANDIFRASGWFNMGQIDLYGGTDANPSYLTTNNILVYTAKAMPGYKTAAYTTNNVATHVDRALITDNYDTASIGWTNLCNGIWMARYKLTGTLEIVYRTFSINETTGILTSVHFYNTGLLESADNTKFLKFIYTTRNGQSAAAMTAVGLNTFAGARTVNSMEISSTGEILGFNTGVEIPLFSGQSYYGLYYLDSSVWMAIFNTYSGYWHGHIYTLNAASTPAYNHIGFGTESASAGATTPITVAGVATGFSGLTEGLLYYTNVTFTGEVTSSSDSGNLVGKAISETEILLNRDT